MNSWLAIIVWIVIVFIIVCIMYYFGYSIFSALAFALLLGIIVLIVCFPWNFRHDHDDILSSDDICDIDDSGSSIFFIAIILSVLYLIAYIIGNVAYDKDSWMKNVICVDS